MPFAEHRPPPPGSFGFSPRPPFAGGFDDSFRHHLFEFGSPFDLRFGPPPFGHHGFGRPPFAPDSGPEFFDRPHHHHRRHHGHGHRHGGRHNDGHGTDEPAQAPQSSTSDNAASAESLAENNSADSPHREKIVLVELVDKDSSSDSESTATASEHDSTDFESLPTNHHDGDDSFESSASDSGAESDLADLPPHWRHHRRRMGHHDNRGRHGEHGFSAHHSRGFGRNELFTDSEHSGAPAHDHSRRHRRHKSDYRHFDPESAHSRAEFFSQGGGHEGFHHEPFGAFTYGRHGPGHFRPFGPFGPFGPDADQFRQHGLHEHFGHERRGPHGRKPHCHVGRDRFPRPDFNSPQFRSPFEDRRGRHSHGDGRRHRHF